jgi:hypothetical protein
MEINWFQNFENGNKLVAFWTPLPFGLPYSLPFQFNGQETEWGIRTGHNPCHSASLPY